MSYNFSNQPIDFYTLSMLLDDPSVVKVEIGFKFWYSLFCGKYITVNQTEFQIAGVTFRLNRSLTDDYMLIKDLDKELAALEAELKGTK